MTGAIIIGTSMRPRDVERQPFAATVAMYMSLAQTHVGVQAFLRAVGRGPRTEERSEEELLRSAEALAESLAGG